MMDLYSLMEEMMTRHASDLHLIPGISPVFRIDGDLKMSGNRCLDPEEAKSLIYSVMSAEKIAEFEKNHELDFSFGVSGLGRFRTNVHIQRGSIAAAFRCIPDHIPSLSELNLPPILAELALKKRGLILVTGPAGCGKSTTLASMIEVINENRPAHIITLEDPIEYLHSHKKGVVEQREVGSDTFSFAESLKRCLRQDPDVILIGEMRDLATIATAITAAETGHLVLATLHTPDAPGAVDRIIDVFPAHQQPQIRTQLASTLVAVIAQILLPRKSDRGRVPAVELLIANSAVRNLIRTGKCHQLPTVMETGTQAGMRTMDQALKDLVESDTVSYETAVVRVRNRTVFEKSLMYHPG
ncbi:MAG: type IV pilus twitching motility protein PilT [bacterium]